MNGHELPGLPGLLDPPLPTSDLPPLPDLQIAPLRNPDPTRHNNAPIPLEPLTKDLSHRHQGKRAGSHANGKANRSSSIKPSDVLSAREAKKPHLAISELVDTNDNGFHMLQLPSFVSLSVVEKSPVPRSSQINPHKRPRLENDPDAEVVEMNRVLPRPSKKDNNVSRPVPLLPAMVTGLHEPPPSAGLLPSMSDARPTPSKSTNTSKMAMKEILAGNKHVSDQRPPEAMLNSPNEKSADVSLHVNEGSTTITAVAPNDEKAVDPNLTAKETKLRRQYRKWADQETADLIAGVTKYGIGRWKQILNDPTFSFEERTAVDLKDRYRVLPKDSHRDHGVGQSSATCLGTSAVDTQSSTATTKAIGSGLSQHRKKRQRWTSDEDAALLTGVSKHGFQWSAIHADPEMNWGSRRPTDLRDRIRTLFPEGYKRADIRPLAKERDTMDKLSDNPGYAQEPNLQRSSNQSKSSGARRCHTFSDQSMSVYEETQHGIEDVGLSLTKSTLTGKVPETRDTQQPEQAGVTLPSLPLEDDDMEWDNRLPPLIEWEEI